MNITKQSEVLFVCTQFLRDDVIWWCSLVYKELKWCSNIQFFFVSVLVWCIDKLASKRFAYIFLIIILDKYSNKISAVHSGNSFIYPILTRSAIAFCCYKTNKKNLVEEHNAGHQIEEENKMAIRNWFQLNYVLTSLIYLYTLLDWKTVWVWYYSV